MAAVPGEFSATNNCSSATTLTVRAPTPTPTTPTPTTPPPPEAPRNPDIQAYWTHQFPGGGYAEAEFERVADDEDYYNAYASITTCPGGSCSTSNSRVTTIEDEIENINDCQLISDDDCFETPEYLASYTALGDGDTARVTIYVRACKDGGICSSYSRDSVSYTKPAELAPAPAGFQATGATPNSVSLSWNSRSGVVRYQVEYQLSGASSWTTARFMPSTTYTVTGLDPDTGYRFRVRGRGDGDPYSTSYGAASILSKRTEPEITVFNFSPNPLRLGNTSNVWTVPAGVASVYVDVDYATGQNKDLAGNINVRRVNSGNQVVSTKVVDAERDRGVLSGASAGSRVRIDVDNDAFDNQFSTVTLTFHSGSSASGAVLATAVIQKERRPSPVIPGTPTVDESAETVTLAWTRGTTALGSNPHHYQVLVRDPANPRGSPLYSASGTDDGSNSATHVITNACGRGLEGTHTARVSHCNAGGGCSLPAGIEFVLSCTTAPVATLAPEPTGLTVGTVTTDSVNLSWSFQSDVQRYQVEQRRSGSSWTVSGSTTGTSFIVPNLASGTRYRFRVRARGDGSPYLTSYGDPSSEVTAITLTPPPVATLAPAPRGLTVGTVTSDSVSLSWNSRSNVHGYRVEYQRAGSLSWTVADTTTGTGYAVTSLNASTTYRFRVRARGDGSPYRTSYGNPSSEVTATTDVETLLPPDNLALNIHPTDLDKLNLDYSPSVWSGGTHTYQFRLQQRSNGSWDTLYPFKRVDSAVALTVTFDSLTTGETYRAQGRRCRDASYGAGLCSGWETSDKNFVLPDPPPAPNAQSLGVNTNSDTTLDFQYDPSNWNWPGASGHYYQVELHEIRSGVSNRVDGKNTAPPSTGTPTASFTGIDETKSYQARGRRCTYSNRTRCGPWGSFTVLPHPPENVRLVQHSTKTNEFDLTYSKSSVTGATHHYAFRREHIVGGNPTGAISYQGLASPITMRNLAIGGTYRVRGRGCTANYQACGFWTAPVDGTLNAVRAPDVKVVPIRPDEDANRRVRISWTQVPFATDYEVLDPSTGAPAFAPKRSGVEYFHELSLSEHYRRNQDDYVFTVRAKRLGSNYADSELVKVKVRDNPITRVDGSSVGGTTVKWSALGAGVTERNLVIRKLPKEDGDGPWDPYQFEDMNDVSPTVADGNPQLIINLVAQTVYAIRLDYRESDGTHVFAGRNAYVWPSTTMPMGETRVGTFPYFGHWPNRQYNYRICQETFPDDVATLNDNETALWIALIHRAFAEWNSALDNTPGAVNVDGAVRARGAAVNCGTDAVTVDTDLPPDLVITPPPFFSPYQTAIVNAGTNEIYRVDAPTRSAFHFAGFIDDIQGACVFFSHGCVISEAYKLHAGGDTVLGPGNFGADMLLNARKIENYKSEDTFGNDDKRLAVPASTRFSSCPEPRLPPSQRLGAYSTVLHEAGHAFGLSGASVPKSILAGLLIDIATTPAYKEAHPTVRESVMNYDDKVYKGDANEQDCSPHPLDVMAVWALYQTIAP